MSTLKTHNLQSPDAGSVNIAMAPNAGMVVTGISTFIATVKIGSSVPDAESGADDLIVGNTSGEHGITIFTGTTSSGTIFFGDGTGVNNRRGAIRYLQSDDSFQFNTNGNNEKVRITSAGNVGIGDNSPGNLLTVAGRTETRSITGHAGTNTDLDIASGHASSNIKFYVGQYGVSADEKVRIDTSGNIGQGTATPSTPDGSNADNPNNGKVFTIYGDSPAINLIHNTAGGGSAGSTDYAAINFGRNGSSSNPYRAVIGYKQVEDILHINANNHIVFDTGGDINSGERFRIDSSGRVMIGTTTEGAVSGNNLTIASNTGYCGMTIRSGSSSEGNIFFSDATSGNGESVGMLRYEHNNDAMVIKTANAERLRITSGGRILGGNHINDRGAVLQIESSDHAMIGIHRNTADHGAPAMNFSASRGTSAGSNTIVQSGDYLGLIRFSGADGSDLAAGAMITGIVDGTPGSNDMPTRLGFWTSADGSQSPTERLRIDSNGYVTKPNHPMFEVTTTGGQNLTNNTREKIIFNYVVTQRGVSFDTSNHRFTAPVAGYYHFDLFVYTYYSRFVECDSRINGGSTGSKVHRLTTYVNPSDQNPCPCMGSWTQYLAKNDYVEIFIYITTSHGTHRYIYGDTSRKPTWWCGYLVG